MKDQLRTLGVILGVHAKAVALFVLATLGGERLNETYDMRGVDWQVLLIVAAVLATLLLYVQMIRYFTSPRDKK